MGKKRSLKFLIWIPIQLVLDIIVIVAATMLDVALIKPDPTAVGHPVPVFTIFAFMLMGAITMIVILIMVIRLVIYFVKK